MLVERMDVGWRLWLQWVAASLLGFGLSSFALIGVVIMMVPFLSWSAWGPNPPLALAAVCATIGGAVGGVGVGSLQQGVLRWHVSRTVHSRWVLATAVGLTVGHAVGGVFFINGYSVTMLLLFVITGAVTGIVGGTLQGVLLLLERHHILRVVWWVAASVVGWTLSMAIVSSTVGLEVSSVGCLTILAAQFGSGAVYGAITGAVLIWLLRRPAVPHQQPALPPEIEESPPVSATVEGPSPPEPHSIRADATLLPEVDLLSEIEESQG